MASVQDLASDQSSMGNAPQAGESVILARRYAVALYDLAVEQHALEAVAEQVTALDHALRQVTEFRQIIADPRLSRDQLAACFASVTQLGQLGALVTNFLALVAQNRRAALLPQIIAAFAAEHARRAGILNAQVRVAQSLSETQRRNLTAHLEQATGATVRLHVFEDPSLIGGMIVHYGSTRIDASLQGRLAALARQLREAA